jgi:hypothetical protein
MVKVKKTRNAYRIFVGKSLGTHSPVHPRMKLESDIDTKSR